MVMVRSSPQKILRHLGSSWCEWLAGTRWPDFFVVQFQSISSLWTWKLERPKEELGRYGDFSCVLCHFHDWKCQVGFVSLFRLSHLGKKGSQFCGCAYGCAVERCRSDGTQGQGSGGGTGLWHHCKRCHLQPAARNLWAGGRLALVVLKKPYLPLLRWMIVYCSDMVSDIVMWFEGFKVQLWIAVNICQALLWHNLQVTDNDRRWKFTVSSVPWIQLWPIGPIRARWPCARPIAQCPFHFILEVNFFWVHSSWVSHIQWPAWWCEISSKSFLTLVQGQYFLDLYGMDSSPLLALRALHVALLVCYEKLRSPTEYARRRASDELLSTELRQM